MICMANACQQGKKRCPTPMTCSGFDPASEAPINFAKQPSDPEPATWTWVDDIEEQAHDLMLALMGFAAAGIVGSALGAVWFFMGRQG